MINCSKINWSWNVFCSLSSVCIFLSVCWKIETFLPICTGFELCDPLGTMLVHWIRRRSIDAIAIQLIQLTIRPSTSDFVARISGLNRAVLCDQCGVNLRQRIFSSLILTVSRCLANSQIVTVYWTQNRLVEMHPKLLAPAHSTHSKWQEIWQTDELNRPSHCLPIRKNPLNSSIWFTCLFDRVFQFGEPHRTSGCTRVVLDFCLLFDVGLLYDDCFSRQPSLSNRIVSRLQRSKGSKALNC